jgi:hypothetical protein
MTDFYGNSDTSSTSGRLYGDMLNIDLREEFHKILFGGLDFIAQGRLMILRKMTNAKCVCFDEVSGGSKTPNCKYCDGEAYYWIEYQFTMWMATGVAPVYKPGFLANGQYPQAQLGYTDPNRATAYCEYNVFPDIERYTIPTNPSPDKLYGLKPNDDGTVHLPLTRISKWKILNVTPMFGDFGRIEFLEMSLEKEIIA